MTDAKSPALVFVVPESTFKQAAASSTPFNVEGQSPHVRMGSTSDTYPDSAYPTPLKNNPNGSETTFGENLVYNFVNETAQPATTPAGRTNRAKRRNISRHAQESNFPDHLHNWFQSDFPHFDSPQGI